jgi:hypothetical protein
MLNLVPSALEMVARWLNVWDVGTAAAVAAKANIVVAFIIVVWHLCAADDEKPKCSEQLDVLIEIFYPIFWTILTRKRCGWASSAPD